MHRFFVNRNQIQDNDIEMTGEDYHHLIHVLRIRANEIFEICDCAGKDYHCVIAEDNGISVRCRIINVQPSLGESDIRYALYQGLPKGSKMDEVIQKNTELGISRIIPFQSLRTVANLHGKKDKKTDRWQKIALSAAKQSKRGIIPEVCPPIKLQEIAGMISGYDLFILCYEEEKDQTLKQALANLDGRPKSVALLIGPEGGLDPAEAALLSEAGAVSVSLGNRILRTETAGQAVLSQLNFYFGESAHDL